MSVTRKSLALVALVATTASLLVSCSQPGSEADPEASPAPGGQIVFATDREPDSLDPAVGSDQPQSLIARQYLDSLVRQEADGSFTPWLATAWDISDDETVYTFTLRDDVTFSDGSAFTAEDVLANIEHWIDPESRNSEANKSLKYYEGSEIVDDHTIAIDLGEPYADFLPTLASSFSGIQSAEGIARGQEENGEGPIGTGPFVVEGWDRQSEVTLTRRDDYDWAPETAAHQGAAYAESIVWRFISEPTTRFGALQSGEVNVIEVIPPESFQTVVDTDTLSVIDGSRTGVPYQLDFNTTSAPFDDVKVRQAFRHASDVEAGLDSVYFGAVTPAKGALSPSTVYYDPQFEDAYPFDIDRAIELLEEAGWTEVDGEGYRVKDGERLVADVNLDFAPQPQQYLLIDQLAGTVKEAGFELVYEKAGEDVTAQRRQDWEYGLTSDYWGGPNTGTALQPIYHSDETDGSSGYHNNGIGYVDPALDAAIDDAAITTDPDERQRLYTEAQRIISDQALALPLYLLPLQYAFRNDLVEGVATDPRSNQVWLYDAWVK